MVPVIDLLKENNVRTGFFEPEQFESVRAHLPAHLRPLVSFMYLTGWQHPQDLDGGVSGGRIFRSDSPRLPADSGAGPGCGATSRNALRCN